MNEPKLKVLSLGWGVQSFTLAAMSALGDLPKLDLLIHADTSFERSATYQFAERWLPWLQEKGMNYVAGCAVSTRHPERINTKVNVPAYVRNRQGKVSSINRQCTGYWKIFVVKQMITQALKEMGLTKSGNVVDQWLGISWDEATRAKNSQDKYINLRYPFLERATRMTRADCIKYLQNHGLEVPVKSSCTHCAYHSQNDWEKMKREGGPDWKQAISFDASIRNLSTKYDGLFIHRSGKPIAEAVPLPEDVGYVQPDLMPGPGCESAGYCWD